MDDKINVLLAAENPATLSIVRDAISEGYATRFNFEYTQTLTDTLKRLAVRGIDVLLLDTSISGSSVAQTIAAVREQYPAIPIITLTDNDDTTADLPTEDIKPDDSLIKSNLDVNLFVRSVWYVIEKKRAEQNRLSKEQIETILEDASTVCHELNQPLQAISGYSELLLLRLNDDDPTRMQLSKITEQISRMVEVARKLNRLTKYGKHEPADTSTPICPRRDHNRIGSPVR